MATPFLGEVTMWMMMQPFSIRDIVLDVLKEVVREGLALVIPRRLSLGRQLNQGIPHVPPKQNVTTGLPHDLVGPALSR